MKRSISTMAVVVLLGALVSSCKFEASTAKIKDAKTCITLSGDVCDEDKTVFATTDPQICVSCRLVNAPEDTKVTFAWKYVEGEPRVIDQVTLDSKDQGSNLTLNSSLSKPDAGWPVGKYQVEIGIGDNDQSPVVKSFEVK